MTVGTFDAPSMISCAGNLNIATSILSMFVEIDESFNTPGYCLNTWTLARIKDAMIEKVNKATKNHK
jgi:hypothetical protein